MHAAHQRTIIPYMQDDSRHDSVLYAIGQMQALDRVSDHMVL